MTPSNSPLQDKIYYFAYGANISSKTLVKRLGTAPPPGRVARVNQPNIALVFGHRGGYATLNEVEEYAEQGVDSQNNLEQKWWQWQQLPPPRSNNSINNKSNNLVYWQPYGVVYELTPEQLQLIEAKEIGYQRKTISITTTLDKTTTTTPDTATTSKAITPLQAVVFVSAPYMTLRHPVAPTQRYRDLILQGILDYNNDNDDKALVFPSEYTKWFYQLPVVDLAVLGSAEYSDTLAEAALKNIGAAVVLLGISYSIFVGGH